MFLLFLLLLGHLLHNDKGTCGTLLTVTSFLALSLSDVMVVVVVVVVVVVFVIVVIIYNYNYRSMNIFR